MRELDASRHIQLMYRYARTLASLVERQEVTHELLGRSELVQAGVVKYLELIGEEAWQLSKASVALGEDIPLTAIANMRHRMVHAYEGVNWNVVETAAFEDVPELVRNLEVAAEQLGIALTREDTTTQ